MRKHQMRRISAMVLGIALALIMTGCGSGTDAGETSVKTSGLLPDDVEITNVEWIYDADQGEVQYDVLLHNPNTDYVLVDQTIKIAANGGVIGGGFLFPLVFPEQETHVCGNFSFPQEPEELDFRVIPLAEEIGEELILDEDYLNEFGPFNFVKVSELEYPEVQPIEVTNVELVKRDGGINYIVGVLENHNEFDIEDITPIVRFIDDTGAFKGYTNGMWETVPAGNFVPFEIMGTDEQASCEFEVFTNGTIDSYKHIYSRWEEEQ